MNVLSARRRTMRARVHAGCRRSSRKERGKSYQKPDCYRQSRTGLTALNDRRFCLSDSWLQRGNICLKTCTSFTAGFMPEIAAICVKKLAAGAPMAGCCGPCSKKYTNIYKMRILGLCCCEQYSLPAMAILCKASSAELAGASRIFCLGHGCWRGKRAGGRSTRMEMGNKEELRILKNCCGNCADAEFADAHKIAGLKKSRVAYDPAFIRNLLVVALKLSPASWPVLGYCPPPPGFAANRKSGSRPTWACCWPARAWPQTTG